MFVRPKRVLLVLLAIGLAASAGLSSQTKAASADETSADQLLKQYQRSYVDPEAPAGTDVTSHNAAMHEDPVMTSASTPDTTKVLKAVSTTAGGRWITLKPLPAGFNAYHMIMGPAGKILLMAGSGNDAEVFKAGTFRSYIWSPTSGITKTLQTPTDMFCSGHMLMSNGEGIAAGGTTNYSPWKGSPALYTFDFTTEKFIRQQDMVHGRWYPSIINTPEGDALITGGLDEMGMNSSTSELYSPTEQSHVMVAGSQSFPLYPHIFLTADRRYFYTGEGWANASTDTVIHQPGFWTPFGGNGFTPVSGLTNASQRGSGASCFVGDVRDQNMMIMGGGWPATASTNLIKLDAATPVYTKGPDLQVPKAYVSCLNLPDGTLLEAGGGSANKIDDASREVSLLPSAKATAWTTMAPMPAGEHRLYHSMVFLTDDGNVISMGSNPKGQVRSNSVLMFEPPYQFLGTKPTLTQVPAHMTYGKTYRLRVGKDVTSVSIDASQSPTHSSNPNMRSLTLPVRRGTITTSFTSAQFPRGYIRVWARNAKGAVSTAKWSQLS